MALRLTGNLNTIKSVLYKSPVSIIPSFFNIQVRHARRKGYRAKADAKKKKEKLEKMSKAPTQDQKKIFLSKASKIEKTIEVHMPDPPADDVFIFKNFRTVKYSIVDAFNFHKEYFHPTIFNNPQAIINIRMEMNLTKNKMQVINSLKGIAAIPHPLPLAWKKDILVFCGPDEVSEATAAGAKTCGGIELVKKVKEGVIQPSLYDYILCHVDFLPELSPIRNTLKLNMPRLKAGTLTADLPAAIYRFLYGIEYQCKKKDSVSNFGTIDCKIGSLDMEAKSVEENFKAVLKDVYQYKPKRPGDFVTYVWCMCPPSPEKFAIDLSLYLEKEDESKAKRGGDDDDDEDDEDEPYDERKEIKKLQGSALQ